MITRLLIVFAIGLLVAGQANEDEIREMPSTHVPRLLSVATKVDATIGETVTFPCDIDELGVFVLLWKKGIQKVLFAGTMRIERDDRFQVFNNTSLKISRVLPKDSGEYICQISSNPPVELTHKLDVLYPPSVKPKPRDGLITAKEGQFVNLSCDATGNPKPKISWKHKGIHYNEANDEVYTIISAQKEDSGEYECIADNGVGEAAIASINLTVFSAPKIYLNPKDEVVVVKEGETVSISCGATGDPTPVITWKEPGKEKGQGAYSGDKIHITEAHRNHAGPYECIANNSIGIFTSATIRVKVLYAPEIEVPNPYIHTGEGTTINITCIVQGEPFPTVLWKRGDQVIHSNDHYHVKHNGHNHVLRIHHVREEDFGSYECLARNSLSSNSENIHVIGTPQIPSFTSKPHGYPGSEYTLSWMVKSHTPIDEYLLIYRKKMEGEEWTNIKVTANEESEMVKTRTYQLIDLEPITLYEAMVSAHNKFGWSKQSDTFEFSVEGEVGLPTQMSEAPTMSAAVVKGDSSDMNGQPTDSSNDYSSFCVSAWILLLGQTTLFLIFHNTFH